MCGLNGIYAYGADAAAVDQHELCITRDHMASRGPDGAGLWISQDRRVALGHRRLAIIDLSRAADQPMASGDGRYHIVFNGEIYNYRALRADLQKENCTFFTHSDTEVLLELYARRGPAMLQCLRGMFAFAIFDGKTRRIFLARDPYGIKPLFYTDSAGTLRFASQVKALLAGGAVSHELDCAGQAGFYLFGSVPEPYTWYRDIRVLPAGHSLLVDERGAGTPIAYHRVAQVYAEAESDVHGHTACKSVPNFQMLIREALLDSVRHHLEADVPVGAFLSAGIDSGALVGLMRDAGAQDIKTITLSFTEFEGGPDDETHFSSQVARLYGTQHVVRSVTAAEFQDDLPRILAAMDQPSIDGINTWFVSKAAREIGLKVAVSGLGGDELFGGYPSFSDIPRWVRRMALAACLPQLGRAARQLAVCLSDAIPVIARGMPPKLPGMLEYGGTYAGAYLLRRGLFMPWELDALLDPRLGSGAARAGLQQLDLLGLIEGQFQPNGPGGAFARIATMESTLYMRNQLLRDSDWAGMAHSLEIRVPLVDAQLLANIAPLTVRFESSTKTPRAENQPGQAQTGKLFLGAAPSQPLPEAVLARRKSGFAVPIGRWAAETASDRAGQGVHSYSRRWAERLARHADETVKSIPSKSPLVLA